MKSFKTALLILVLALCACERAKNPLGDSGQGATFTIYPDRVKATAELVFANKDSFGHPSAQALHFSICLQNLISGQNIVAGTPFGILDGLGVQVVRKVDADGCVHWDESHSFSYFSQQRNIRVQRTIRGLGNHRGDVLLTFNVKPWLDGSEAVQSALNQEDFVNSLAAQTTFGFNDPYPVDQNSAPTTRFDLANNRLTLQYIEMGKDSEFELDPYMNLTIPYRYTFSIEPMITHQLFDGSTQSQPVTGTRLRVTFVLFASGRGDPSEDNRYVTSTQVEGTVGANGIFNGSLLLKYPHTLFASGRQTMLMQISPVDDLSGIKGQSFVASLSFVDQQAMLTMSPDTRNADVLHQANQSLRLKNEQARPLPLAEFINRNKPIISTVDDFPATPTENSIFMGFGSWANLGLSKQELMDALTDDGLNPLRFSTYSELSVQSRLCLAYLAMIPGKGMAQVIGNFKTDYQSVMTNEKNFIYSYNCADPEVRDANVRIQHLDFIEELVTPIPRNVKMYSYSNQEFGIYYAREHSVGVTEGFALRLPGSTIGQGFIDLSLTHFETNSRFENGKFSNTQFMAVDIGTLEFYAKVRSCVLISGRQPPFTLKPWLICKSTLEPAKWIAEDYYYYAQIFAGTHSPFIDPFNAQTGVKVLIRGKNHMQRLLTRFQDADFQRTGFNVFVQSHVPDLNEFNTLGPVDSLTDQDVPGAMSRN